MKKLVLKKPTAQQVRSFLRYMLFVTVGNALAAAGAVFFLDANGFVMGGVTGLGIFVRNMITLYTAPAAWHSWVVNITVYAANIALFILGAVFLGKKFAVATLAGTLLYPAFMSIFKLVNDAYLAAHGDIPIGATASGDVAILAVICGAALSGIGIAFVMRIGASTGGTDIPPLILNKYFGTSISGALWVIDFLIILLNVFAKVTLADILWGVIIALLASMAIEALLPVGVKKIQVKVVSKHYQEIREMIMKKLKRGVTVLYGQTGYLKEKCYVILTVVNKRELVKLKEETHKLDPEAFMMVSVVSEVVGRGFTKDNLDLPRKTEEPENLEEISLD